ncbi:probable serine/threonine-protein kinase nek3 [Microplitis demolitor]|uniref:probable serine/threonine-protein kinase nek3 n=1 Tax=Microplitis demolitor TaxID=69319 RepID=UPI0004CDA0D1|nr:probable serine/threonine-protein kinase nek3 [Microplitis demolitor]
MIRLVFFVTVLIICQNTNGLDPKIEEEAPKKNHAHRRAVDGSRGNTYYEPTVDDSFDIYDPYDEETDLSSYRLNVPGEPGVDYPSYRRIPQTSFTCERQFRGYYADEEAGCQLFHVCDGNFLVSSFLCPIGSTFSQRYLTCDWWNKVDCSSTKSFYQIETSSPTSEVIDDGDEYLRRAYEMTSLQSSGNGVSVDPQDPPNGELINETPNVNDLHSSERFSDYSNDQSGLDYSQYKYSSRYSNSESANQRNRNSRYYSQSSNNNDNNNNNNNNNDNFNNNNNNNNGDDDDESSIKIHTVGRDRKDHVDTRYNNDFRPSYAPTVPTVTTTTRRFYSPTIPTIVRSTASRSRHDLEFESSDHLYSAKGKNRGRITPTRPSSTTPTPTTASTTTTTTTTRERITPVTPASVKTTSPFAVEVPTILKDDGSFKLNKISFPRPAIRFRAKQNDESITEKSNVSEFSTIDLNPLSRYISTEKPPQVSTAESNSYSRFTTTTTEKSQRDLEISSIEFHPYNNHSSEEQSDELNSLELNDRAITRPSSSILPPFYYYSNVEQHDNVVFEKFKELGNHSSLLSSSSLSPSSTTPTPNIVHVPTTLSWFQTTLESPVTDVIPLLKNEIETQQQQYTTIKSVEKSSSPIVNSTVMDLQRKIIEPPSVVFDPPLIHSLIEIKNSTYPPETYEYTLIDNKNIHINTASDDESSTISDILLSSFKDNSAKDSLEVEDAAVGESSPVEVTLTVNNGEDLDPTGELIRSLIAQHDPTSSDSIRDIEISRSNSRTSADNYRKNKVPTVDGKLRQRPRTRSRIINETTANSVNRRNKFTFNDKDSATDNVPRPFSLTTPPYDIVSSSIDNNEPRQVNTRLKNTETVVKDNYEVGDTKHEGLLRSAHTLFDLPKQEKTPDFKNKYDLLQRIKVNNKNLTRIEPDDKLLVETELVPSLGFSLNTDEDREKFADAILHGLFTGVSSDSNVKKKVDEDLKS